MPRIRIDEAGELTVADITHAKFSALPARDGRDLALLTDSRRVPVVDAEASCSRLLASCHVCSSS